MAFHKPRDPYSKAGVWSCYVETIGAKRVAALVGVSLSSIYNATEPDHPYLPTDSLETYETLDVLCVEAGKAPPFARYYAAKVGSPAMTAEMHIEAALLDIGDAYGATCHEHRESRRTDSEAGADLSENEHARLKQRLASLHDQVGAGLSAVDAVAPRRDDEAAA